jgi:hypothetical protein
VSEIRKNKNSNGRGRRRAEWTREAQKVVVTGGCFLHCHGRILKNLIAGEKIAEFGALAVYQKQMDLFDIDEVPEAERKHVARQVADNVLAAMEHERQAGATRAAARCAGCAE